MKHFRIIACLLLLSFTAEAQVVNILEEIGINDIKITQMEERGKYLYFIRNVADGEFSIWKYDKFTLEATDSFQLYADSISSPDTIAISAAMNIDPTGNIHLRSQKKAGTWQSRNGFYYNLLDADFNPILLDKWVDLPGDFAAATPMHNSNLLVATSISDAAISERKAFLHIIDHDGSVTFTDTAGLAPYPSSQELVEILPYPHNQYLIAGKRLFPDVGYGWYITDSVLNIIDTFKLKPASDGYTGGYNIIPPGLQVTPSGSVFGARTWCIDWPNMVTITKHLPSSRFRTEDNYYAVDSGIDADDLCHQRAAIDQLKYNSYDNSLYLIAGTHNNEAPYDGGCNDPRYPGVELVYYTKRYAEVTCVDTNLNLKWRKYIRFDFEEGHCVMVGKKVVVPDNREGILFTGQLFKWMKGTDTLRQFVYHITEGTTADSTILGEPTSIDSPGIEIRNRVKLYPNPARDIIHINDLKEELASVSIVDMYGRLLIQKDCKGADVSLDIAVLPAGIYLARVQFKDGEIASFKFSKR